MALLDTPGYAPDGCKTKRMRQPIRALIRAPNPNQFFVFGFTDAELPGFVPQQFRGFFGW